MAGTDNEERYQAFIKNSSEGIWRCELDKPIAITDSPAKQIKAMYKYGYLAEANDAMAQMYGFKKADALVGARLGDLLVEDDPANQAYLEAFIASDYRLSGVESHETDKAGRDKYFSNSLVGYTEKGMLIRAWGTQQDVTEQHAAAQALRHSEQRLALALKASRMGLWELDLQNEKLTWSNELKKLFGLKKTTEVTLMMYREMIHPDDREYVSTTVNNALQSGKGYRIEFRITWPNGKVHWIVGNGQAIMENGKAARLIGTAADIDEQKASEQALRESEQRFRAMADSAPVLIWESDANQYCTYLNSAWLNFTGRKLKDEVGDGWTKGIHPADIARCLEIYNNAFDARTTFNMEYRLRRHDNKYRWMLDNGSPRFSTDGEFLGYIGSCMDIHEVKRSQKLEAVNQTLTKQRSQLMALNNSKEEFISIASHQLRTPATGVKQYLGMLIEGYTGRLTPHQINFLKVAYESNERQLTIIDDLLKVAHVDADKVILTREPTDIISLINTVLYEQRSIFKQRGQKVTILHTKPIVTALIDSGRMRMVFENLIDNASKYSVDGKVITITIRDTSTTTDIAISDSGVGIAKKDIDKLFQKFSRINNSLSAKVGGTGIGLYWARRIVDLHGGTINVESVTKKGSTFTVKIPK